MERIKDLEKVILKEDGVLAEVFQKKSLIITASAKGTELLDHCKVLAVGDLVKDIKKGDIILQLDSGDVFEIKGRTYVMVRRYGINVVVTPDNIDLLSSDKKLN